MALRVFELKHDSEGIFKSRPNRFLGIIDIIRPKKFSGKKIKVHIQDPGRLNEILFPGNRVLLKKVDGNKRKTQWDLLAGFLDGQWVLVHTGYHRKIAEWVIRNKKANPFGKINEIKPEVKYGHSRLDFLLENTGKSRTWVEVKGCTLAENNVALFPDAPTIRGTKHLNSLISAKNSGDSASVLFLVFRRDASCFKPNRTTDPDFADTFSRAVKRGVRIHVLTFYYDKKYIFYDGKIKLCK